MNAFIQPKTGDFTLPKYGDAKLPITIIPNDKPSQRASQTEDTVQPKAQLCRRGGLPCIRTKLH